MSVCEWAQDLAGQADVLPLGADVEGVWSGELEGCHLTSGGSQEENKEQGTPVSKGSPWMQIHLGGLQSELRSGGGSEDCPEPPTHGTLSHSSPRT